MKVLVFGAKGVLGSELVEVFQEKHDTIGLDREDVDITNYDSVEQIVSKIGPQIVINSAVYGEIDSCENNPNIAYSVNVTGAANIAKACKLIDASVVQISSDYVFEGQASHPYKESDETNPVNVYGKTKVEAEKIIKAITDNYYIVRTAFLFGCLGNNHLRRILRLSKQQEFIEMFDNQICCPSYTKDVAKSIEQLIQNPLLGTYHFVNSGYTSRYGFAQEVLQLAGIEKEIRAVKTYEINRPALRPSFTVLENSLGPLNRIEPLRDWRVALKEVIANNNISSLS